MATVTSQDVSSRIVKNGTFKLQTEDIHNYKGVVVLDEKVLLIYGSAKYLQFYNRHSGKLISQSHILASPPNDVCLISKTEVAVGLFNGTIEIMSLKSIYDVQRVQKRRTGLLCFSLRKLDSDKLIVSGWKKDDYMLCWGILSITDERMDATHDICIGHWTHMAIKEETLYISCQTNGVVVAYDICDPQKTKFKYQHPELQYPWSIMAEGTYVYVCDMYSNIIHQLSDNGQLVTIHKVSSCLDKICYDEQHGLLYTTCFDSNVITVYKMYSLYQPGVPIEILKMDDKSIQLFDEALKDGKESVNSIRIMVVGHMGAGKTTLVKRLLGDEVNISEEHITEGTDVYVTCCDVSLSTNEWIRQRRDSEQDYQLQRLVKVLNKRYKTGVRKVDSKHDASSNQRETTYGNPLRHVSDNNKNTALLYRFSQQCSMHNLLFTSSLNKESSSTVVQGSFTHSKTRTMHGSELGYNLTNDNYTMGPLKEMLKLLQQNPNKAKQDASKHAHLSILDFAGQYAHCMTHQMYPTRRAIYLIVSDASREVIDHDIVQIWKNSIHSCAPRHKQKFYYADSNTSSGKVIPPPVILVGTHIDQIPQMDSTTSSGKKLSVFPFLYKRSRTIDSSGGNIPDPGKPVNNDVQAPQDYCHEQGQRYLKKLRSFLRDKPTSVHLVDEDFAIDNTVIDSKLEDLKKKIVEVASQQRYLGDQIPTRWFLLEQQLLRLKDAGVKVVSYNTLQMLNNEGTVRIENSEELDLFLKYLHETGTVIYFSIEILRDNVLLDPKWIIDALNCLISAQPNLSNNPVDNETESNRPDASAAHSDITQKWSDFKEKGILTVEFIDSIWTKDLHPELHEHKELILMIMEQLNIIAKPRSFNKMGEKVEKYFITPCMLRQEIPSEFTSLEQDNRLEITNVLSWDFRESHLSPPIVHRLIAACITRWPVSKTKETSERLIFCDGCIFDIDLFHRLTLYSMNHIVFAKITRLVIDEVNTPEARLCTRVRKFITLNLSKITSCLGQNLQYQLRTQCPTTRWNRLDSVAGVSLQFDMSFADEDDDQDAPITPEHMNYARLRVALITVCGNALRKILLCNFPVPYADIYQVILANRLQLTERLEQPLLNRDQIRLLYPKYLGNEVGTLDQCDISLLYVLIRNVSTVPEPITGWDMDPCNQPRDTSLGASAERIHSYRNSINGQSADGRITRQGLEDYWNKFEDVIRDIEAVLGENVCSQELEKQRKQVISIYEAC